MRKLAAVAVLALIPGIGNPARPPTDHQNPLQGKIGDVSSIDLWRHYLLAVAWDTNTPLREPGYWGDRKIAMARKFRAEFEKAIDDFNEAQENRIEADQIAAMKTFVIQRDAMVESYKNELLSTISDLERRTAFKSEVSGSKTLIKSLIKTGTAAGIAGDCGLPNSIGCSIIYSMYPAGARANPDGSFNAGFIQILDGPAIMTGNPQHARHTPTVTLTVDGKPNSSSGRTVCADCYLYVIANASFVMVPSVQYSFGGEGVVTCSEAGKFFDVTPGNEEAVE